MFALHPGFVSSENAILAPCFAASVAAESGVFTASFRFSSSFWVIA